MNSSVNPFAAAYLTTGDARISPMQTKLQAACYKQVLLLSRQANILDVGCGNARHSIQLSSYYRQIVGLDIANDLLQLGSEEVRRLGLGNVELVHGDMRALPFADDSFDGVLNGFSSWGLLSKEENAKSIQEMGRVLRPGGVLVFDYGNLSRHLHNMREQGRYDKMLGEKIIEQRWQTEDGRRITRKSWLDNKNRYHWECQEHDNSEPIIVGMQQGYLYDEILAIFKTAGLKPERTYGDYDMSPYNSLALRIIIGAIKKS